MDGTWGTFHAGVKKCHFVKFTEQAGMAVLSLIVQALKNPSQKFKKKIVYRSYESLESLECKTI